MIGQYKNLLMRVGCDGGFGLCQLKQQLRGCINSGLDYWNSGIVDWRVFVLVFILYLLCSFGRSLLHLFCITGLPDFEGY